MSRPGGRAALVRSPRARTRLASLAALVALVGFARAAGAETDPVDVLLGAAEEAAAQGRLDAADAAYAEAAARAREARDRDREAQALGGRLGLAARRRDAATFDRVADDLVPLLERAGRHAEVRRTRADQATLWCEVGRAREALARIPEWTRRAEDAQDVEVAAALDQAAAVAHLHVGEFGAAVGDAERAVARWPSGASEEGRVLALSTLASVLQDLGSVDRAERLHQEVLAAVGEADGEVRAATLGNLGFLAYEGREDPARGDPLLREAIAVYERLGDAPRAALGRLHLARAWLDRGEVAAAADLAGRVLVAAPDDPELQGHAWALRSRILRASPTAKAQDALEAAAQAVLRAEGAGSIGLEAEARCERAAGLLAAGRPEATLEEVRRALRLAELAELGLPDEQAATLRAHHHEAFSLGVRAAVRHGDPAAIAEFLERSRAGALRATLGQREAGPSAAPSEAQRAAERGARERVLAADRALRAAVAQGLRAQARAARAALDAAHADYVAVTEAADRGARLARPAAPRTTSALADVQRTLRSDQAMVLYALEEDTAGALVIGPRTAQWQDLGSRAALASTLDASDVGAHDAKASTDLEALRRALVAPLPLPRGTRQVLVSPDGTLATVPFTALFAAAGQDVALVPSATVWRWWVEEDPPPGRGTLALGAPDYALPRDAASAEVFGHPQVRALPGTEAEIARIASGPDDVRLSGPAATEARVRELAASRPRWRLAYFACHGAVNRLHPERSALLLSPDAQDDGYLCVHDVMRLRLAADLVVLAACESAQGSAIRAEGLYGLPRAFLCAGAPRVVGSLWKVDDEATRALMYALTRAWSEGRDVARALRAAQDEVRATPRWSHPRYWAAWVLWGLPK